MSTNAMTNENVPEDEVDLSLVGSRNGDLDIAPHPRKIKWLNVLRMLVLHAGALYGLYLVPYTGRATIICAFCLYNLGAIGITAGAHRLWTHRSYKAKLPMRIALMLMNCVAFQKDIIDWSLDHRVHHKYSETEADPHNAKRGFFFSHIGWLMVKKHPDVIAKGKQLNIDDLLTDPVLKFQRKFYVPLVALCCFILPTVVPYVFFGQSMYNAYFVAAILRYVLLLHATWLVNSAAHMWGWRPYDKTINPAENPAVAFFASGEGFHNFHHSFPQDYSTAEFGWVFNLSTMFIDICAFFGQAYDRKSMPKHFIERKKQRNGSLTKSD